MNIAICDDNQTILNEEYELVQSVLHQMELKATVARYTSPIKLLQTEVRYDVIILDVEMDELSGIRTANRLKKINRDCFIFFVTNYGTYLDEALNQHAFRFWTKPLERRKLIYGLKSVIKELYERRQKICVTVHNEQRQILTQNIIYLFMENKKLHIITTKGEVIANDTIKNIQEQLKNMGYFTETARGYYVNLNYVKTYTRDMVCCVCNQKSYEVCISRRKYNQFHKAFIDWVGSL